MPASVFGDPPQPGSLSIIPAVIRRLADVQRTLSGPKSLSCAVRSGLLGSLRENATIRFVVVETTKNSRSSGDVSMPLLAESWVPGSCRNDAVPGVQRKTAPVVRPANASSNVLPGMMSTVATSEPSLNEATLLAAILSGMSTHPVQAAAGAGPEASSSKTSIDSRPPWFVAYTVNRPFDPVRRLSPCRTACFGSSGPGQLEYLVLSARTVDAPGA